MSKFDDLHRIGQSIWYDNIQRDHLLDGTIQQYIESGMISGITSNPSIFKKAIAESDMYEHSIRNMAWAGMSGKAIYEQLVIEDIQHAADLLYPLYQATEGNDGYISLEVNPELAQDSSATLFEAQRLWELVERPNLMIKIPATEAGLPAIRQAIAQGINVNVTLIFSCHRYEEVIEAYLAGLEDRIQQGLPLQSIASVASFFVSRFDSKIDKQLPELPASETDGLFGKAAVANARIAYRSYQKYFSGQRFQSLAQKGARVQRPLWASTSTKDPAYSDVMYVEELVGPDTVNTIPPVTLLAFDDHGTVANKLSQSQPKDDDVIARLAVLGIDLEAVAQQLETEGVAQFQHAFTGMLEVVEVQRMKAQRQLGDLRVAVKERLSSMASSDFVEKVFAKQADLWTDSPEGQQEIAVRLGWLDAPLKGFSLKEDLDRIHRSLKDDGFEQVLLIGMGGSSLAAEVMSRILGTRENGLELRILDATDPSQVANTFHWARAQKTVYLISSKSGSTAEVMAGFSYAWQQLVEQGVQDPGDSFIAVTDPGTSLQKLAQERGFRAILNADPTVGGRYSALTAFGLLPAELLGADLTALLKEAASMQALCESSTAIGSNPGAVLGAILGEAFLHGRDKLTILADDAWLSFGSWVEQLIAESSGKQGKGILPVDLEPLMQADQYKADRIFVYMRIDGKMDQRVQALQAAGHPCLVLNVKCEYSLVSEFYRWEFATAVACAVMSVNAFDQPNVQDSKTRTKQKIKNLQETGTLEWGDPLWEDAHFRVFSNQDLDISATNPFAILREFLQQAGETDFIAVNAFVERNDHNLSILQEFRKMMVTRTHLATTLGFGPRFLHSTGQLHKGGRNNGFFIVLTNEDKVDLAIPSDGISYQQLVHAQALGDIEALHASGRKVLHIHIKKQDLENLIKE